MIMRPRSLLHDHVCKKTEGALIPNFDESARQLIESAIVSTSSSFVEEQHYFRHPPFGGIDSDFRGASVRADRAFSPVNGVRPSARASSSSLLVLLGLKIHA
jgi:hypothetical protein